MKKSVNLYFQNNLDTKEKLNAIKSLGYEEFYTGFYDAKETLTWKEQIEYAKQIGLGLTMIHCSYKEPLLNDFWEDNENGDFVEKSYISQIEECGSYTKNFVVHLNGAFNSKQTEIGLERIKRILKVCEKFDVNLAIENLYSDKEIPYVFNNISHPLLKICFDCGHKNFLTKDFELVKNYGKYISVFHLHDNDGISDQHKILGTGTIDLNNLAKEILGLNLTLAAEIRSDENYIEVLKNNIIALNNFENLQ